MDRLQSMRVFQRVVDEGGFAAAARVLDMSPAVVTRLVADLEDHLGTRLLHRSTRRLSLSEAGEAYLARVRAILQDIDDAHALASSHSNDLAGELHILALPVFGPHVLAPLMAGFKNIHPKITLDITVETFLEPPVEDYDLVLFAAGADYDGDVIARKIVSTNHVLVAAPSYLKAHGVPKTPQELQAHQCLHIKRGSQRSRMWRMQNSETNEIQEVLTPASLWTNHIDTLLSATLAGGGISSIALALSGRLIQSGALVRVLSPWTTGQYAVLAALPSRKFLPRRTRVFLDYLSAQMPAQLNDTCHGPEGS
ncbi:MAG: LysR family transcriptional regulator [Betaproteobacteria bacterium]|nr:LysR family transcriptional regulator [Betaproteobacteria bacterium]